jgi:hypothetical protein
LPSNLTTTFIDGSRGRPKLAGSSHGGATAMTNRTAPEKSHPSLWAVGLLFLSSAFALISIVLFSTGYSPL